METEISIAQNGHVLFSGSTGGIHDDHTLFALLHGSEDLPKKREHAWCQNSRSIVTPSKCHSSRSLCQPGPSVACDANYNVPIISVRYSRTFRCCRISRMKTCKPNQADCSQPVEIAESIDAWTRAEKTAFPHYL